MDKSQSAQVHSEILYKIEDVPPLQVSILLAFQHIMAAFGGIVAVPLVVGGVLGLPVGDLAYLVSAALFMAGVATFIQAKGIGKCGARVPCVMGTDFTFVGPSIAVGFAGGLPAIFGATILGSFVEIILSRFIKPLRKFFPPIVTGTVVTLIGLTLLPVSIDWAAGGFGSADYGSLKNVSVAMAVMIVTMLLNRYGKGIVSSAAVILGLIFGYAISFPLGMLHFEPIKEAGWIALPSIFKFGVTFSFAFVLPFITAYLVTTIETVGVLMAIGEASGRELSSDEIEAGILADGVGSFIAGFLGAGPNTSFSQNVGLIPLTKVASKFVVVVAGIILMLLGIFPKFGALIAIMPNPVLGGAGIIMFGVVAASGIKTLKNVEMSNRNLLILAVSLGLGLGVTVRPDFIAHLPEVLKSLFSSGISAGTISALVLNIVLTEEPQPVVEPEENVI
ncbi:NCS2 family nucleobase:cation symporter-2 [Anaerosolibacter carboniphilus]|uniref:NCS2 family nucleobase:cation symporter-2 n=1 Tax=Anaerosolibacter carboniphilus TaxID=1417629 RepID=A0A841L1J6_9FIRM|nr:nucleobase:cation symporter-2 family protein [Anaerosolibacter carboniphilus]MBB6218488.1 NCS2 family nucleobase:cation symporter-2 [Anaerosolibacter carboniphilus]